MGGPGLRGRLPTCVQARLDLLSGRLSRSDDCGVSNDGQTSRASGSLRGSDHEIRRVGVLATLVVLIFAALASAASARVRLHTFTSSIRHGAVTFHVANLRGQTLRWGRLRTSHDELKLSIRVLRTAARTGRLRVRLSRTPRPRTHTTPRRPVARRRPARRSRSTGARRRATLVIATQPVPKASIANVGGARRPTRTARSGRAAAVSSVAMPAIGADALYVSPSGSDLNPGTQAQPWRTLAKATSAAKPGQTVVFEPGTYGARGQRTNWTAQGTSSAPITFIGDPNAAGRPTILGYNVLYGAHVRVWNMLFDGPTGSVDTPTSTDPSGEEVMLWLTAPDIEIANSEIRNSLWHAGIYLTNADGDKLVGDYIHDNGNPDDPTQANLDHGIYWSGGNNGVIADNIITHNVAMGIQLYPDASNVTVNWNTIADNGKSGIIVAEGSADNTISHNLVFANADDGIRSWSLTGTHNIVTQNLIWNNANSITTDTDGLTLTNNSQADPQIIPGTYHITTNSPAVHTAGSGQNPNPNY